MSKKQKKQLKRIIIALICFCLLMIVDKVLSLGFKDKFPLGIASLIPNDGWLLTFSLFFLVYIYIGYDVIRKAFINILHGQMLDENFLMCVATIGAFSLGIYTGITTHDPEGFDEGCAVLLFYQVGEFFQSYAVGKSRKEISSLMDIRPDYANLKNENGEFVEVSPEEVKLNDIIQVKPGEKIPLDGVIVEGSSSLDTKALTGESLPRDVNVNDNVISGSVNLNSTILVRVEKEFYDSTVSKILDLVENASSQKSRSENFITKFSRYYTPIVVSLALVLAIVPPLIYTFMGDYSTWTTWIYRALSFLVVSCPCALVISVPLTFFTGIGYASKKGILVKGSIHLERFNDVSTFIFDKTGTLTKGNFVVSKVFPLDKKEEILRLASIAENQSTHPIARSIKQAYGKEILDNNYSLTNIAGKGIKAVSEDIIFCGNEKLMLEEGISFTKANDLGTIVYVAKNKEFIGYIVIEDEIKDDAKETIDYLNKIGAKSIMLTGDNEQIASSVASRLGLTTYKASLLPQDKVEELDKVLNEKTDKELVAFVGDGINDAPSLVKSDIGISMGGVGSDAAIEASDIVLMHDDLKSIVEAKKIARKTMCIVFENIIFALGVKVVILVLSALGITNMWIAVFGDVGVAIIAILNAMRVNSKK